MISYGFQPGGGEVKLVDKIIKILGFSIESWETV